MKKVDKPGLVVAIVIFGLAVWAFTTSHNVWGWVGLCTGLLMTGASFQQSTKNSQRSFTAGSSPLTRASLEGMGIRVIDGRPDWEKQMEQEVRSDLGDADEECARRLCMLIRQDSAAARTMGEELYSNGGHRRMVRVCLRVKALGGDAAILERRIWNGVGEWMG